MRVQDALWSDGVFNYQQSCMALINSVPHTGAQFGNDVRYQLLRRSVQLPHPSLALVPCGMVSYQDEQFITTWRAQKLDGDRYQPTGILPGSRSCLLITAPVWLNVLCRLFSRGTVGGESGDSSVTDPSPTVLQSKGLARDLPSFVSPSIDDQITRPPDRHREEQTGASAPSRRTGS